MRWNAQVLGYFCTLAQRWHPIQSLETATKQGTKGPTVQLHPCS